MGVRGDMEARYWAELGHEKPREMALYFFECLKDPNVWLKLQDEYKMEEILTYLDILDRVKKMIITNVD